MPERGWRKILEGEEHGQPADLTYEAGPWVGA